ncbi:MAG TPA: bifunctional nitrate reductase/sulfite reductase flavoprotein subunit alpha [Stellaceae bacterium]|nr:bifunctional nitrate reductase/sulfite reductase flavoprotein subunit alpha [Stellaceae bacterium]
MPEAPLPRSTAAAGATVGAKTVKTACPYCGVGCGMNLTVEAGKVSRLTGDKAHPANAGRLCTKGSTAAQALTAPGRLSQAFARDCHDQAAAPLPMAMALAETARRLKAIIRTHGPEAVGFYVSGQMSIEAQYLSNKLAKGFIGTNSIDSNSRLCMASAASGYKLSLGADGPPGSYDDLDQSDLFFVIGANMADCHPILFLRLLDRRKQDGVRLIVVDPRRTATADKADLFLQIAPGTDLALLNGLLHLLVEAGDIDGEFIAGATEGWEELPDFLADYTPSKVAAITGLAEADIRLAASWIAESRNWMSLWTMGLNQSIHGTWQTNALINLHLATGTICKPGNGPFSLTGQPNAMGGREMGYLAAGLPGQRSVTSAADRAYIERVWDLAPGTIKAEPGLDTVSMFRALKSGAMKAVWIICTNPVASVANRAQVIDGLKAADLVIVQDAFQDGETVPYADILLPGALWAEASGVLVNSERNMTLTAQAVEPPGEAMADWRIIAGVAQAMGYPGFDFADAAAVFDEIRLTSNLDTGYALAGVSHDRLARGPVQWPCVEDGPARNPIRYVEAERPWPVFPRPGGKARFFARPYLPPRELPDTDYPFVLTTGRLPHQWHTRTKTGKIAALTRLDRGPFVELSREDAEALGIGDGDTLELAGRRGRALLPAVVSDRMQPGLLFVPFHWSDSAGPDLAINALTDDAVDPISLQPAFKFAAIRLTRVAAACKPETAAVLDNEAAVTLLWASQTGNAERLATTIAEAIGPAVGGVRVIDMADYPAAELARERNLLVVTSTYGDGEPPDNGAGFWRALHDAAAPPLDHLRYAVLALGDSSYDRYCGHGRALDERLAALGARALANRAECDGPARGPANDWLGGVFAKLAHPEASPLALDLTSDAGPGPATHGARLLASRRLNAGGGTREIRHYALGFEPDALSYEPGDALGVIPSNCPELVAEIRRAIGADGAHEVVLPGKGTMPLDEALSHHLDITRITPALIDWVARRNKASDLVQLAKPENNAALKQFLWGRQLADLLIAYPVRVPVEEWLGILQPLQPRLYSISSSPRAHGSQVHATISTVRFDCGIRRRKGVASTYLAERARKAPVPIFIQKALHFRLPEDPDTPIIMIGPGTGIAPFRAFLHDRQATGATGANWLFFGAQHAAGDFYYKAELKEFMRAGTLTRLDTAFSRDQMEKIYVQHRMVEQGRELWDWLQNGAYVYICGDAGQMARDVDKALNRIAETHGGMSPVEAADYIQGLADAKRYRRDVY